MPIGTIRSFLPLLWRTINVRLSMSSSRQFNRASSDLRMPCRRSLHIARSLTPVSVERFGTARTASASSIVNAALGRRFSTFGNSSSLAGFAATWSLRTAHLKNALTGNNRAFCDRNDTGSPRTGEFRRAQLRRRKARRPRRTHRRRTRDHHQRHRRDGDEGQAPTHQAEDQVGGAGFRNTALTGSNSDCHEAS